MKTLLCALCVPLAVAVATYAQVAPAPAPPQTVAPQEKPQVFRAGIEVVSLNVTVTDAQGHYITDLTQDDFSVFEDGIKQELSAFGPSTSVSIVSSRERWKSIDALPRPDLS